MAVKGVYSELEKMMLEEWNQREDPFVGWLGDEPANTIPYPVFHRKATQELIENMAYAVDFPNLLWRDDKYARATKWGGVIAPPFYEQVITHGGPAPKLLQIPPEMGSAQYLWSGSDWKFFKPIRPGDTFRVWVYKQTIEDVTDESGFGPRKFNIYRGYKYINQNDELVTLRRLTVTAVITPPDQEVKPVIIDPTYRYTQEEIDWLDKVLQGEELRGAQLRFWEDVEGGEELTPNSNGPFCLWDMIMDISSAGLCVMPMSEKARTNPAKLGRDPETKVPHNQIEWHIDNHAANIFGFPNSDILQVLQERIVARLVTRWMGDDGWIKSVATEHRAEVPVGDALLTYGKVIDKYEKDGEYLVDLIVWSECVRGYVSDVAKVTVSLPSKKSLDLVM